jgi:hypothetical protein
MTVTNSVRYEQQDQSMQLEPNELLRATARCAEGKARTDSERDLCPKCEHSAEAKLSLGETGVVSWSEDSRGFGSRQDASSCCVLGRNIIVK